MIIINVTAPRNDPNWQSRFGWYFQIRDKISCAKSCSISKEKLETKIMSSHQRSIYEILFPSCSFFELLKTDLLCKDTVVFAVTAFHSCINQMIADSLDNFGSFGLIVALSFINISMSLQLNSKLRYVARCLTQNSVNICIQ